MTALFDTAPDWFKWALHEVGTKEVPGTGSKQRIIDYRKIAKIAISGDDSVIPWCAIFVNGALEGCGVPGSRSAAARSFVSSPNFITLKQPVLGCIVVLSSSRGPATGHVSFYRGEAGSTLYLLGGNQGDKVSIAPFKKAKVVGYYWPKSIPVPKSGPVLVGGSAGPSPSDL